MHILVISISAPPKNSPESLQTGKYIRQLAESCEVSLLTTNPEKGWAPEEESLNRYLCKVKQIVKVVRFSRIPELLVNRFFPSLMIPDEYAFFHWQWRKIKLLTKPDILFSRSTPFSSAVMGYKLKKKYNVPWIMHLSDTWVDNPFYKRTERARKSDSRWEYACFNAANLITVTSPKTRQFYFTKYPDFKNKIKLLQNVIEREEINPNPVAFDDKIRFVFTGRLYGSRSPIHFLRALEAAFKERPDLIARSEIILAGFADEPNLNAIKNTALPNIRYLGHIDQTAAIELQRNAHVLLLIDSLEDDDRYDNFFPSKLLEYFAARRKIIAITRKTSTTHEALDLQDGRSFSESDLDLLPGYIITCIEKFIEKDVSFFSTSDIANEYTSEKHAQILLTVINELMIGNDEGSN